MLSDEGGRVLLVSLDLGWWRRAQDERRLRSRVLAATGLSSAAVLIHLAHTHAGPYTAAEDDTEDERPVAEYLEFLARSVIDVSVRALDAVEPALITWSYGRCGLAVNRDLPVEGREVVAFNPDRAADDTLLVGRVTGADERPIGTIVNYACHPTTLSWQNTLASPDWLGSARQVVEAATGAPCVILQGASGELSPRDQATSDLATADRNGRVVGHAVLATLENLPPAGTRLVFQGVVESGAPLGLWSPEPAEASAVLTATQSTVELPVQHHEALPGAAERAEAPAAVVAERRLRHSYLAADYVYGDTAHHPLWVWRIGDSCWVAHPGEAFSDLQIELRQRHPDVPIVVMNCTNGPGFVYLPPRPDYAKDKYQVWQTVVGPGSLERLIASADDIITHQRPPRPASS